MVQIGRFIHGSQLAGALIAIALMVAAVSPAHAMITRHDVDDDAYLQAEGAYHAVFDVFEGRGGVATLVAPQWALTVGHVGEDIPQGHQVTIAGQSYTVKQVVLHPDWETRNLEMALVELNRPIDGVDPIPLYNIGDEQGQIVTFVGRGDSGTGLTGPVSRDHRLRAATNRIERVEGSMLVFRFDAPGDENVTPLEGISGPGDSGGPAFLETAGGLRLAGLSVASSGRPKGRYGAWEFYTRISPEVKWVWDTTSTEYVESDLPARSDSTGEVTIVTTRVVSAGEVGTIAPPGSASAGELGPIVIRRSMPTGNVEPVAAPVPVSADEVETVATPGSVSAGKVEPVAAPESVSADKLEPEGTSGSEVAVYAGVAILAGLALTPLAWWYRRRRQPEVE